MTMKLLRRVWGDSAVSMQTHSRLLRSRHFACFINKPTQSLLISSRKIVPSQYAWMKGTDTVWWKEK